MIKELPPTQSFKEKIEKLNFLRKAICELRELNFSTFNVQSPGGNGQAVQSMFCGAPHTRESQNEAEFNPIPPTKKRSSIGSNRKKIDLS